MNSSKITFANTDKLQLQDFANTLERFIKTEREFVDGSLVLSLNAPFGAGKSTFIAMWHNDLIVRRTSDPTLPLPMMLNAWESDHCGDPLLAIVSGISTAIDARKCAAEKELNALREAAKDVAWFTVGLGNSLVAAATDVDVVAAGGLADEKKAERANADGRVDLLKAYESRLAALRSLKVALGKLFADVKAPGFIFVDELDRCRPDYAVAYLETIKHVFDSPDLVFVLAVDKEQLRNSVRALYGEINFNEYYRKFVHRNIGLKALDTDGADRLVNHYYNRYFTGGRSRKRNSRIALNDFNLKILRELIVGMRLTLRQVEEMFRIVGHVVAHESETPGKIHDGYTVLTILMAALSVARPDLYAGISSRTSSLRELGDFLQGTISEKHSYEWWVHFVMISYTRGNGDPSNDDILKEWKRLGLAQEDSLVDIVESEARNFSTAFGRGYSHSSPFTLICRHIDGVNEFD